MASVSSLDKDLARSRKARYTPEAAAEVTHWIQEVLKGPQAAGELMDVLKDGSVLCEVANKLDPAKQIRYKKSAMPFVQMENISHFLSFVAKPPVSLPPHDLFLTVDLYEKKDPAQVVQCLTSFSRIAHTLNASAFPNTIGGVKATALSPQISGGSDSSSVRRALSNGDKSSGAPPLPGRKPAVSTWSRKADEGATLPAWNIAQYGYMGGASQGNQGISFGGRRQITATPASTASPAGTARLRNQSPAVSEVGSPTGSALSPTGSAFSPTGSAFSPTGSAFSPIGTSFLDRDRARKQQVREEAETRQREEEEARQRAEAEAAEAAQAIQEQADLEARQRVEADEAEAAREAAKQEEEKQAAILEERRLWKAEEEKRLLWQQEQDRARELERAKKSEAPTPSEDDRSAEREKIRQLEEELARARERERTFEAELQRQKENKSGSEDEERRFLQGAWKAEKDMYQHRPATPPQQTNQKPLKIFQRTPGSRSPPKPPPRALPTPPRTLAVKSVDLGRSDSTASWMAGDDSKPLDSPSKEKKDFKWARMSLLERERERERERQKEWEQSQQETQQLADAGVNDGEGWDVNQYGYLGGADQAKMGVAFGARRQIIGPRPQGPGGR